MNTRNEFSGLSQTELDTFLGEYLYDLNWKKKPLDETRIEALLQAGANPNCHNKLGDTLLYEAIRACNDSLVALLMKYGANVNQHNIPPDRIADPSKKCEIFQWAVGHEKTLLQVAINEYYGARRFNLRDDGIKALRCYDLIASKFVINAEYIVATEELQQLYVNLYRKISNEVYQANKKPILVVLGESHVSLVSLMIEVFTFLICKQFNFNLYLAETNKQMFEILRQGGRIPGSFADWKTIYDNLPFALRTGYEIIPVDLGAFGAKRIGRAYDEYEEIDPFQAKLNDTSEQGMIYRDSVIHNVISEGIHQNAILVVGSSHLIGLQNKKFNHHVVFINATDVILSQKASAAKNIYEKYQKHAAEFLLSNAAVYHPKNESLKGMDYFWHPNQVIATAERIHATFTNAVNMQMIPLSSKWFFTNLNDEKPKDSQQEHNRKYPCTVL